MPRRNNHQQHEPLDLTPLDLVQRQRDPFNSRPYTQQESERAARDRVVRQRNARINGGIDWTACLVPNCDRWVSTPLVRDHTEGLPLCFDHLLSAYSHARAFADEPIMHAAADRYLARRKAAEDAEKAAYLARTDGAIYFVRLNDLVKVGWTRSLKPRIKSYGASAELLVTYPGTRDDETNLHRQLTPARAKGREWYEDGPIVQGFIDKALAQYGMPPTLDLWTKPKQVVAGKRHR